MEILILTPHYPPREGGTSEYVARLCEELQKHGHKIHVVTREGSASQSPTSVEVFKGPWSLFSLGHLLSIIRDNRPDVILLQYGPYSFNRRGPGLPVVSLIIAASILTKTPFVVYGHELYTPWRQSYIRFPWHFTQRVAIFLLLLFSKRFVTTIESRRRRLTSLFPWWRDRINVVPVAPTLDREIIDSNWRKTHGIDEDTILLSAMGTDDPEKGARLLGNIADAALDRNISFRFVTIGGMRPNHPHIESWGYVDAHDAWNLLASSDLFIMPYDDGVSARRTSALNALAAGAPMLTTYGINTDEALFPKGSLMMAPAGQIEELTKMAVTLAGDESARQDLRSASQDLSKQFSWSSHIHHWEHLMK